ncbi:hypothetical protein M1349_02095 [Patescibacteria group bacterium]|nr:hypothetical protein [Patescibacteria group bacterium]
MDEERKKSKNSFFEAFMWWKIDQGDIENEVQNYSKSNRFSFRKIAGYLILVSLLFTVIFVFFGGIPSTNLIYIVIYLPLAILVMRGSKFFILLAMVLITLDRFASILILGDYSVSAIGLRLLWWALQMRFLYAAYKVERLKKHTHESKTNSASSFLKKPINIAILTICIVTVTYFGILIIKEVLPKSNSEKQIECLRLGSDFARRRCLLIIESKKSSPRKDCGIYCDLIPNK